MEGLYREKNGQLNFLPVKEEDRARYIYHGPVFLAGRCIAHMKLYTWANSLPKAHANLIFQIKKELGHKLNTKVTISKNLIKKEECKYGKSV